MLELAVFDARSVPLAEQLSVPRIELCIDYPAGGITPPIDLFLDTRTQYSGDIFVMIRPRGGDFVYSADERTQLIDQARAFISAGADGIVAGFLTSDDRIDVKLLEEMMAVCEGKPFTFHRAFDRCPDPMNALDQCIKQGVSRILTSGGAPTAHAGINRLIRYQQHAGSSLCILAGGGIRVDTIQSVLAHPEIREVHSAAIRPQKGIGDDYVANPEELAALLECMRSPK